MNNEVQELIVLAIKTLSRPFYEDWAFWAVIMSVASSLIALFIAFKDQILRRWNRPNFVAKKIEVFQQINSNKSVYWLYRLQIVNEGKAAAINVEIDTSRIIEDEKERRNFLPAPLRWTHGELYLKIGRDIGPSQSVYLDIATFCPKEYQSDVPWMTPCSLWLSTLSGMEIQSFSNINLPNTILELKIFSDNLTPSVIILNVRYDNVDCQPPTIKIMKQ